MRITIRQASGIIAVTGAILVAGCTERGQPPPPEPPILSAPLFREPVNDEEAKNADELRAALEAGQLGFRTRSGVFPDGDWVQNQGRVWYAATSRSARFDPGAYQLTVYEWNQESAEFVPALTSELPVEICERVIPLGGVNEWLTTRHIEVLVRCGDETQSRRFIFDTETATWAERPRTWAAYVDAENRAYTCLDGVVTLPDGSTFVSSILDATLMSANFVISEHGRTQNFRTGELFEVGDAPKLNQGQTRAFVRTESGFQILGLDSPRPLVLIEYELPPSTNQGFQSIGWQSSDRWVAAHRAYNFETFYLPGYDEATLLIDSVTAKVYEVAIAGGFPYFFRTIP